MKISLVMRMATTKKKHAAFEPEMARLSLDDIIEPDVKVREKLDPATVEVYQAAYEAHENLPAITVYRIDGKYVLSDGAHRKQAKSNAVEKTGEERKIDAEIHSPFEEHLSPYDELFVTAVRKNRNHGLRLSSRDRDEAIRVLDSMNRYTQEEIAGIVGCSQPTVSKALHPKKQTIPANTVDEAEELETVPEGEEPDPELDQPILPEGPVRTMRSRERAYERLRRPTPGEAPEATTTDETGSAVPAATAPLTGAPDEAGNVWAAPPEPDALDQQLPAQVSHVGPVEPSGSGEGDWLLGDAVELVAEEGSAFEGSIEALTAKAVTPFVRFEISISQAIGIPDEIRDNLKNYVRSFLVTEEGGYDVTLLEHSDDDGGS